MAARKRLGLGIAPYCLPEKSITDKVTHEDLQRELRRLRQAVMILASRSHDIGQEDARQLGELLKEPSDR